MNGVCLFSLPKLCVGPLDHHVNRACVRVHMCVSSSSVVTSTERSRWPTPQDGFATHVLMKL
jgi:endonuclease III